MDDVELAILTAWLALRPRLAADPRERRRRLARRSAATLARPLRATCLALRANDTRLPIPPSPLAPDPSPLTLCAHDIQRLCTPITLTPPGGTLEEIGRLLGVSPHGLLRARVDQILRQRYVAGLGGRWGHPRPVLYCQAPLDPAARGFAMPDPAWSWTTRYLAHRLPADFPPQNLRRVAAYHARGGAGAASRYRDTTDLHPEHPLRDPPPPRPRRSLALPEPPPDPTAAHHWKDGVYLGYDWRNPLAKRYHERHEKRLAKARLARKKRRRDHGPALSERSESKGSLEFRGYAWLCPRCEKPVRLLYLPLPPVNLIEEFHRSRGDYATYAALMAEGQRAEGRGQNRRSASDMTLSDSAFGPPPSALPTFACARCLKLRRQSRCDPNFWNEIVTHLTGGLLFGREVKRPAWLPAAKRPDRLPPDDRAAAAAAAHSSTMSDPPPTTPHPPRKLNYTPRPNRAPSKRRPQVESLLLAGRTFEGIALALGLSKGTVLWHARQVYRQHGVRTLRDFLSKHRDAIPPGLALSLSKGPALTREVRHLLLSGLSIPEIVAWTGANKTLIYNQRQQLRKQGKKLPDARVYNGGSRARARKQLPSGALRSSRTPEPSPLP